MEAIIIEVKNESDIKFWLNLAKKQEPGQNQSTQKILRMLYFYHPLPNLCK